MVERNIILERFILSEKYIQKIKEIVKDCDLEEFKQDIDKQIIAERSFEVVSINIVEICTYIMSNLSLLPGSYAECMEILGTKNIVSKELANRLADALRMRNFIVHQYEKIDYELLYGSLNSLINDYYQFKEEISLWIDKEAENHN